jgi:signal-transduction protein with cAMP-binding, CBS, and nucleotidyltransferase domain
MKIQELMKHKVETNSADTSTRDAAIKMHDLHIGSLLVVNENNELQGIITDRDICCKVVARGRDEAWTKVHEVMHKDVVTCFDDQDINDAASLMASQHIRRLAILNRNNSMSGFLSVDDLAHVDHDLAGTVLEASIPAD